jgi:hypothetical protein
VNGAQALMTAESLNGHKGLAGPLGSAAEKFSQAAAILRELEEWAGEMARTAGAEYARIGWSQVAHAYASEERDRAAAARLVLRLQIEALVESYRQPVCWAPHVVRSVDTQIGLLNSQLRVLEFSGQSKGRTAEQ